MHEEYLSNRDRTRDSRDRKAPRRVKDPGYPSKKKGKKRK